MNAMQKVGNVLSEFFGKKPTGDEDIPNKEGQGSAPDNGGSQQAAAPQGDNPPAGGGEGQPQGGGQQEKIPEADVIAAITRFRKDRSWKKILDNAPENARNRIALNFYFSMYKDKPGFDRSAYLELRRELEAQLTHDDLVYLITTSKNEAGTKHFRELLMRLPDGGEGQGENGGSSQGGANPSPGGQNPQEPDKPDDQPDNAN